MNKPISKAAVWAATGVIGAGVIGGVTYAAVATPATASSNVGAAADAALAAPSGQTGLSAGAGRLGRRALLNRLEHGELTLKGRKGDVTVDLQRGSVVSVTAGTLVVHSADGFPGSYTVDGTTKVRGKNGPESISAVHPGDKVLVIAKSGTAVRIVDRG